jgi:hypothetical protein
MGGKFPVDIPPNSNYIPGISDQFPLSSFADKIFLLLRKKKVSNRKQLTAMVAIAIAYFDKYHLFYH